METVIGEEKEVTEEQIREALRTLIHQMKESQERWEAQQNRIARLRADREQMKAETRESLARIDKIIARF